MRLEVPLELLKGGHLAVLILPIDRKPWLVLQTMLESIGIAFIEYLPGL